MVDRGVERFMIVSMGQVLGATAFLFWKATKVCSIEAWVDDVGLMSLCVSSFVSCLLLSSSRMYELLAMYGFCYPYPLFHLFNIGEQALSSTQLHDPAWG